MKPRNDHLYKNQRFTSPFSHICYSHSEHTNNTILCNPSKIICIKIRDWQVIIWSSLALKKKYNNNEKLFCYYIGSSPTVFVTLFSVCTLFDIFLWNMEQENVYTILQDTVEACCNLCALSVALPFIYLKSYSSFFVHLYTRQDLV